MHLGSAQKRSCATNTLIPRTSTHYAVPGAEPQPVIGSYRFNASDCTVQHTNRPLLCTTMIMENNGTPRTMHTTYPDVGRFTSAMLTMHDNYLLSQPHAVRDADDAQERFALRTFLRAVSHHFTDPCRNGPYRLQLTDLRKCSLSRTGSQTVVLTRLSTRNPMSSMKPVRSFLPLWIKSWCLLGLSMNGRSRR